MLTTRPVGGDRKQKIRFFEPTVVKSSPFRYIKNPMANTISTTLNSIFDTVHRHMKSQPRILAATPPIPQPILDINRFPKKLASNHDHKSATPLTNQSPTIKSVLSRTSQKQSGQALPKQQANAAANIFNLKKTTKRETPKSAFSKPAPRRATTVKPASKTTATKLKTTNLSQLKATVQQKCQQNMRRALIDDNGQYYANLQSRIKEIKRHRQTLDEILRDYTKLKRDRETLAHDMQVMKGYLDDITGRLDESVKKLNKTPTMFDRMTTPRRVILNNNKFPDKFISKPKKSQRPIKLHSSLLS